MNTMQNLKEYDDKLKKNVLESMAYNDIDNQDTFKNFRFKSRSYYPTQYNPYIINNTLPFSNNQMIYPPNAYNVNTMPNTQPN
jgi:hypothetical protein